MTKITLELPLDAVRKAQAAAEERGTTFEAEILALLQAEMPEIEAQEVRIIEPSEEQGSVSDTN
jgi:hypothetical protein